jgi:hypothetical protein
VPSVPCASHTPASHLHDPHSSLVLTPPLCCTDEDGSQPDQEHHEESTRDGGSCSRCSLMARACLSLSPSLSVICSHTRTNTGILGSFCPRRALHSVRSTLTRSVPCRVPAPADHSHAASAVVMCAVLFVFRCAPQKGLRISVRTRGCSGNAFHLEYANVSINTPPTHAALRGHDRRASAGSPRVPRVARKDVCQEFIGWIDSRNNPCCPTKLVSQQRAQLAQTTIHS